MAERGGFIGINHAFSRISAGVWSFLSSAKPRILRHKLPVFALSSLVLVGGPVMAHQLSYSSTDISVQANSAQKTSAPQAATDSTSGDTSNDSNSEPGANASSSASGQVSVHAQSDGNSTPQVTVNGQQVPVPANGHVYQSIPKSSNSNSQTIDVQVHNNSSDSTNTRNSLNVQVYSNGSSSSSSANNARGADRTNIRDL